MFLPLGTDAPLYHRPITTVGLIAANVVTFWLTSGGSAYDGWILQPGHLQATEWFSCAFLHFGIVHLVGNMIFLWLFGLIVEGKLGWWKFLLLYAALCAVVGFVTQLFMLGYIGPSAGAGGASAVIYALMAISLVWAPLNCVDVVFLCGIGIWHRLIHRFDVTVLTFALFYIGNDVLVSYLVDFELSTPVLHVLGAFAGFPIGVLMLRRDWVDCEGWDVFSVLRGEHRRSTASDVIRFRGPASFIADEFAEEQRRQCDPDRELRKIRRMIQKGQPKLAAMRYQQLQKGFPTALLDQPNLRTLIDSLQKHGDSNMVVMFLEEYIERFPQSQTQARLMLVGILTKELQRPKAAIRVLDQIDATELTSKQKHYVKAVRRLAEQQLAEGVIELREPVLR